MPSLSNTSPASPPSPTAPGAPKKSRHRPQRALTRGDCVSAASVRAAFEEEATHQQVEGNFDEFLARSPSKRKAPVNSVRHHDQVREERRAAARARKKHRQAEHDAKFEYLSLL